VLGISCGVTANQKNRGKISMKNKLLLFSLAIFFSLTAISQQGFTSVSEAAEIAREIVKASGRQTNFTIKEGAVSNAMAVIMNNKRFVLYNPGFINSISKATGTKWSAVSVLAHEIGHHLYSRIVNGRTVSLSTELEADEFSGYILRKLGATLEESQAAMKVLASDRATRTHPARYTRLSYIEKGWESTESEEETFATVAAIVNDGDESNQYEGSTAKAEVISTRRPANVSYVFADLSFDTDPGIRYFVTDKYNVVKIKNGRAYTVGKLAKLSDRHFPYIIYDGDNNKVFIDTNGLLINEYGRSIGRFKEKESNTRD